MAKYKEQDQPAVDSSLGLVYRLNNLWVQADYYSQQDSKQWGNWDLTLNSIYNNLSYDENYDVEEMVDRLTLNIFRARKLFYAGHKKGRALYYSCLQQKDIFLRRLMQKKKLYLKESKSVGDQLYAEQDE